MHLAMFVTGDGTHHGGWRHPSSQPGVDSFEFYRSLAQRAEDAKLDMLFVADKLGIDDIYGGHVEPTVRYRAIRATEPITLLSALAVSTQKIGLGGTISTSYTEPYHTARMFASIDHLSNGRAAWNAITSVSDAEARNFGRDEHYAHDVRYDRAEEYIEVVRKLWDSWGPDAVAPDKAAGTYSRAERVRYVDHEGKWFKVRGPLNVPRPPQGHPVLIQAGASGVFVDLAARNAEVVFAVYPEIEHAKKAYREFKDKVASFGRPREAAKLLPGLVPIIADTDEEAHALLAELDSLVKAKSGLTFLSGSANYDLAQHDLDGPVPDIRDQIRGSKGRFQYVICKALEEGWTVRELGLWYGSSLSFAKFVGSPQTVANEMEQWVREGAADGFVIMPAHMPEGANRFMKDVVPLLQERGLFRSDYEADTLRGHLGLREPEVSFG